MKSRIILILAIIAFVVLGAFLYFHQRTPANGEEERGVFGGVSLNIQFATTTAEQELGLGNRPSLPSDYGMLFVFPTDGYYGFWMKDTLIPLDMFWLNDQGQVIWMEQDVATDTYPGVFYPDSPARYVLETAAGFAAQYSIATGTALTLPVWPNAAP